MRLPRRKCECQRSRDDAFTSEFWSRRKWHSEAFPFACAASAMHLKTLLRCAQASSNFWRKSVESILVSGKYG
jgi:hypothetical protein